jgi:hypothetical protein
MGGLQSQSRSGGQKSNPVTGYIADLAGVPTRHKPIALIYLTTVPYGYVRSPSVIGACIMSANKWLKKK